MGDPIPFNKSMRNYNFFSFMSFPLFFLMLFFARPTIAQTIPENIIPNLPEKDSSNATDLIIVDTETKLLGQYEETTDNGETTENDDQKKGNILSSVTSFFGNGLDDPTALQGGASRRKPVLVGSNISGGLSLPDVHYKHNFNEQQNIGFTGYLGTSVLNLDFAYNHLNQNNPRQRWGVNIFNVRSFSSAFVGGETEVNLSNGDTPWLDRLGTGIEYAFPLAKNFNTAVGISYQKIAVRDAMFSSNVQAKDELGNKLTISNDGQDLLLTANLSAFYQNVDDPSFPKKGSRARFGLDQSIPVGDANIGFTRISGNYSQFIPLFIKNDTLIVNFQAGGMFGDVPAYEAFNLGGQGTVRGYEKGGVATGSSFILASAEYRFPITDLKLLGINLGLHGNLFIDYGSDLGTANEVVGNPGDARDKPGDGLGYGFGLLAKTPFGPMRLELAFSDLGNTQVVFTFSDRF